MKCNKTIYNKDWFKVSNRKICRDILVDHPTEIMRKATLKMIHKTIWLRSPAQIYDKFKFNIRHRECSPITVKNPLRKQSNKRTPILTGLTLYNSISTGMKLTHPKKLKRILKKFKL